MFWTALKISCDISRRSRRKRRILEAGGKTSDPSPLVPVETPQEISRPPNRDLTPLSREPTGTTESRTTLLINGTLATMVRAD